MQVSQYFTKFLFLKAKEPMHREASIESKATEHGHYEQSALSLSLTHTAHNQVNTV